MKLISLNTMAGRALYPLMRFFEQRATDTDIFCLQEVLHTEQKIMDRLHPREYVHADLFNKISALLKDFNGFYAHFEDNPHRQSLAMFINKKIKIEEVGDQIVYQPKRPKEHGSFVISSRKIQYAVLKTARGKITVVNFHGLWSGGSKKDSIERIEQSKTIKEYLNRFNMPIILCGDFNLLPNTKSIKILEKNMHNLIKENKVKSTRTPLYRNYNNPLEPNFADYVLVTPDIKIKEFKVLPDIASDHAPVLINF